MNCRILITIFTIWIHQVGWAQNVDRVYPGLGEIVEIREKHNSGFLLITRDFMMHSVDAQGNLLQSFDIDPPGLPNKTIISVFDDFLAQDSIFYVTTFDNHCDYFENSRLYKLDTLGNVIEEILIQDEVQFGSGAFLYPESPGDPEYIFPANMEILVWYDGGNIESIPFNSYIDQLEVNRNGDFAILTQEEIFYYTKESGQFSLNSNISIGNHHSLYDNFFFTSGNDLLWSTEHSIVLFNPQLDTIAQFRPPAGEKFIFIKESKSHLIAVTVDGDSIMKIYLLDPDLIIELSRETTFKQLALSDALFRTDSLLTFTGIEFYEEDKWFTFIKDFSLAVLQQTERNDVAISDIKYDHVQLLGDHDCYGNITNMYSIINPTIEITNHGSDLIDELTISPKKTYCGLWCDAPQVIGQQVIRQMNLMPGESKNFAMGDMTIRTQSKEELCLVAILPDIHLDADHQDNIYCFDIITRLSPIERDEEGIIYPNPADDILYIGTDLKIDELNIYSLDGRSLINSESGDKKISISHLKQGAYIIKVQMENGSILNYKFIKSGK